MYIKNETSGIFGYIVISRSNFVVDADALPEIHLGKVSLISQIIPISKLSNSTLGCVPKNDNTYLI
jgi:hypothetical protein